MQPQADGEQPPDPIGSGQDTAFVKAILEYLNQRGYQMVSFERVRRRVDQALTDQRLEEIIARNSVVFREAMLKDGKKGQAKLIP